MNDQTGKDRIYGAHGIPAGYLYAVNAVAGITFVITLGIVIWYLHNPAEAIRKHALQAAWAWWVSAPPIWFSFEYFNLFKKHGPPGSFEAFKYGQDIASKAWLVIVALLSAILVK